MSSAIRLRWPEGQDYAKAMVERLVFQPWFLEQVKAPRFVKNDLVPNERLQRLVGRRIDEPLHLSMQAAFDRTETRDDAILEILDMGKHFVFFHTVRDNYVRLTEAVLKIRTDAR